MSSVQLFSHLNTWDVQENLWTVIFIHFFSQREIAMWGFLLEMWDWERVWRPHRMQKLCCANCCAVFTTCWEQASDCAVMSTACRGKTACRSADRTNSHPHTHAHSHNSSKCSEIVADMFRNCLTHWFSRDFTMGEKSQGREQNFWHLFIHPFSIVALSSSGSFGWL